MLGRAAVDAGDIDLNPFEHGERPTRRAGRPAAIVLHGMLLHTARGIRDQGGGVKSILLNGITRDGVSPVTKPRLPGHATARAHQHQWVGRPRIPDAPLILGTRSRRREQRFSFWPDQMRFERIGGYRVTAKIGEGVPN